ncbi:hypothetical protein WICPIJ_007042 [Wickerhamomyces pijperi]|uniref:Uncharacterized protein n=1 Tax=Wickerhamomyces pijperi TaxID=599730 RepID=A0A9P8Q1A3_WICPI|nr:hypothetical protein WICPIJ_007042 [Wickerhamomyces pijperi]
MISANLELNPCKDFNWFVILMDKVPAAWSLMSLNKCSTPISSASSASIMEGIWLKVFSVEVPSSLTSSMAMYASVGIPMLFCWLTSTTSNVGLGVYFLKRSLIFKSEDLNFGPE